MPSKKLWIIGITKWDTHSVPQKLKSNEFIFIKDEGPEAAYAQSDLYADVMQDQKEGITTNGQVFQTLK